MLRKIGKVVGLILGVQALVAFGMFLVLPAFDWWECSVSEDSSILHHRHDPDLAEPAPAIQRHPRDVRSRGIVR